MTETAVEEAVANENGGEPTAAPVPTKPAVEETQPDESKVLDLTSIAPNRRLVKLPTKEKPEGDTFELRLLDDFGIAMQQKLLNWSRTYERLFNKEEDLTEDEETRLKFVLDSLFDKVLDAPKATKKAMPDAIRARVMMAFSLAPLMAQRERAEQQEAEEAETSQTPETSTSES